VTLFTYQKINHGDFPKLVQFWPLSTVCMHNSRLTAVKAFCTFQIVYKLFFSEAIKREELNNNSFRAVSSVIMLFNV